MISARELCRASAILRRRGTFLINLSVFRKSILIFRRGNILGCIFVSTQKLKHLFLLTKCVYNKEKIQSTDLITLLRFVVYRPTFALLCSALHFISTGFSVTFQQSLLYFIERTTNIDSKLTIYIQFFTNHKTSVDISFRIY